MITTMSNFGFYTTMPPEIALAMLMEEEELATRGVVCEKCGRVHLPEELTQGLCDICLDELALEVVEEIEMERIAEEAKLTEMAEMYITMALMRDDYPEY